MHTSSTLFFSLLLMVLSCSPRSLNPLFFVVNLLLSCLKRKQKEERAGWEVRGMLWSPREHGRE